MNTYDFETHEYRMNGVLVPHITEILPEQKFFVSLDRLEEIRQDGEENHSMIKLFHDTGDTYKDPMLEALARWIDKNKSLLGELALNEKPLFSEKLKFGGRPDDIFTKAIVDFKRSPGNSKYHALQTAAQHILAIENKIIGKTKIQLIAWYDGKEFKSRNVYNDRAEQIFTALVKKYWIDQSIENYFKN